jgi:hypothetical protein
MVVWGSWGGGRVAEGHYSTVPLNNDGWNTDGLEGRWMGLRVDGWVQG